ncbi:MAG: hypothetical protein M0R80_20560 [Proteobacteria bacterium]|nr:hypothetical protein [Pseudomonadota bacterium]
MEMKRRGAERVVAETAGMTPEQELEYWRLATEALEREQREIRARGASRRPSTQPA